MVVSFSTDAEMICSHSLAADRTPVHFHIRYVLGLTEQPTDRSTARERERPGFDDDSRTIEKLRDCILLSEERRKNYINFCCELGVMLLSMIKSSMCRYILATTHRSTVSLLISDVKLERTACLDFCVLVALGYLSLSQMLIHFRIR